MPLPFIHPWMLAGTAMGSAPVVIHLLNRQRYKRITWAAMHWLLASFKKSSRRLQIEDLILLIIRILILVLLALALARPFLQGSGAFLGGRSHVHRVIVLDTSFSMAYKPGAKSSFELAKEVALKLTHKSTLSSGDAVTLIYMTDQAKTRIKASTNLSEVYHEVGSAEPSHSAGDSVKALALAFEVLDESNHPRKEIFLITDMGRNCWVDPQSSGKGRVRGLERLRKAVRKYQGAQSGRKVPPVFLVDVGAKSPQNAAVTRLSADVNVIAAKSPVVFKAEVTNHTDKKAEQLPVTFAVNGERVSSQLIDVGAGGGRKEAMFFHQFEVPGPHWVSVSTEGDRLALDDTRHMAVPVVPSLKVLAVDGEEKSSPLESETGLLVRVLSPRLPAFMAGQGMTSPSIISTRVVPDSQLGDLQFEGQDLVILANVPLVPEGKLPQLRKFVHEGGAVLVFVGDRVDPQLYNERLFEGELPLLPCRLLEPEGEGGNPDAGKFWTFRPDDATGAVLPTFARKVRWALLSRVRVFKRYRCALEAPKSGEEPAGGAEGEKKAGEKKAGEKKEDGTPAGEGTEKKPPARVSVPLKYDDGQPAILIREYGLGKVALVTTTADKHWNNLPERVAHLPMMHDLAYSLVHPRGKEHNLEVGGVFSVRWPAEDLLKKVEVMPPAGHEDGKRTIKPESRDNMTLLTCTEARWAGRYELSIAGEDEPRDVFVTNLDSAESDLEPIEIKELRELIKEVTFKRITDREKIAEAIKAEASGREFWRSLTWAVLTLAVVETFLAWFFGRKRW